LRAQEKKKGEGNEKRERISRGRRRWMNERSKKINKIIENKNSRCDKTIQAKKII
jgi:hypothetical protein